MIRLNPNEDGQKVFVSPYQSRKFLPTFTHYLMVITSMATKEEYIIIPSAGVDNERYTRFIIGTLTNDAIRGQVPIKESGMHTYRIYGQNSSSNLNPNDTSVVVGEVEQGVCVINDAAAWTTPSINVPDNVVYYQ